MCSRPSSMRKRCETYHNDPASSGHRDSSFTASLRVQTTKSESVARAARSRASSRVNAGGRESCEGGRWRRARSAA